MAAPPPAPPEELRKKLPSGISDEEFLLRATMPAGEVDAMLAAGPARRRYNPRLKPVLDLLGGLAARPPADELLIDKPGFRLALRAASEGAPGG
jgi:oxaloacetate decarboxylase alpha subunit